MDAQQIESAPADLYPGIFMYRLVLTGFYFAMIFASIICSVRPIAIAGEVIPGDMPIVPLVFLCFIMTYEVYGRVTAFRLGWLSLGLVALIQLTISVIGNLPYPTSLSENGRDFFALYLNHNIGTRGQVTSYAIGGLCAYLILRSRIPHYALRLLLSGGLGGLLYWLIRYGLFFLLSELHIPFVDIVRSLAITCSITTIEIAAILPILIILIRFWRSLEGESIRAIIARNAQLKPYGTSSEPGDTP